ncbi:LysE family transporter [Candidatus Berkiella aquae]|uniref:Homoserine/homoserine lactone efflux protein n=1 Tax=Candidatus Berkiella aquae TaxID=295108 RepID=A0A0Q9Z229_9GAMM|nr:LysE family transporter [Candidatus Berkiella aquae]MCS5712088.1 LysE family transporter [Candidatus Berkiella aquae]
MFYLNEFLTLAVIGFLGAISPGPDFVIVTQHSLQHGKKSGLYTAIGIALGCLVHVTYCVIGIGIIVAKSVVAFNIIKYCGAAYLIYLGCKGLFSRQSGMLNLSSSAQAAPALSSWDSAKRGFLVNILNPKATLFFLSVFSQVIDPQTPRLIQALFGLEFSLISLCWFGSLAFILTHDALKQKLTAAQKYLDKMLGGALIALGLKVATLTQ